MDKLQSIAVFMEIAERGSLSAAAIALDKSLPSVVRILANLEADLEVRLFNRTTRRLTITDDGRLYLEYCRKIVATIEESELAMSQSHREPTGSITLTASIKFGEMYIAPLLVEFLAAYPKVEIKLLLLDRLVDLIEEGIDVAVRIAPVRDSHLVAKPITQVRQVICAAPSFLQQVGRPKNPQDLSQFSCIRSTGFVESGTWTFQENGQPCMVDVKGRLMCNSIGSSLVACIAGAGFGRFLWYQVLPALQAGELEIVLEDFEPEPRPLSLIYLPNRLRSSRMRIFIDWMAQRLKDQLSVGA